MDLQAFRNDKGTEDYYKSTVDLRREEGDIEWFFDNLEDTNPPSKLYISPDDQQRFMVGCRFSPSGNYLAVWGGSVHVGSAIIYDGFSGDELFRDETTHTKAIFSLTSLFLILI